MRGPARIERVLATLRRVWGKDPDLRLGQLVVVATKPQQPCFEVFNVEDDVLLESLLDYERLRAQIADVG